MGMGRLKMSVICLQLCRTLFLIGPKQKTLKNEVEFMGQRPRDKVEICGNSNNKFLFTVRVFLDNLLRRSR
jgi:hypothetical protein